MGTSRMQGLWGGALLLTAVGVLGIASSSLRADIIIDASGLYPAAEYGAGLWSSDLGKRDYWCIGNNRATQAYQIEAELAQDYGIAVTLGDLQYKSSADGESDEGDFADDYDTSYSPSADPSGATISQVGNDAISSEPLYLYVKDGKHDPAGYVFDITGWNGTDDIVLSNFWPDKGCISHVAIFSPSLSYGNTNPEPASVLIWFVIGLMTLLGVRRPW